MSKKKIGTLYKFCILLAQYSLATTVHNSNDKHKTVCRARMDTRLFQAVYVEINLILSLYIWCFPLPPTFEPVHQPIFNM